MRPSPASVDRHLARLLGFAAFPMVKRQNSPSLDEIVSLSLPHEHAIGIAFSMTLLADLMLGAQENARSLSRILAPDFLNRGDSQRKMWLRHYEHAHWPRVPKPVAITPNTLLLLYMFVKAINVQGVGSLPNGTRLLLAANCLPFLKPGGLPSPRFSLSPFMVVEQRQWYRLITTAFLHVDIDHTGQ